MKRYVIPLLLLLAFTLLATPGQAQQPGDLVITEVLVNPGGSITDANGEWFELYNNTNQPIDLQNWFVQDSAASGLRPMHKIKASLVVPAYGFIVLGSSTDTTNSGGVHVDYAYRNEINQVALGLANSLDAIRIVAPDSMTVIDRVKYYPVIDVGAISAKNGISRELLDVTLDNLDMDGPNWVDAEVTTVYGPGGRGTPGVAGQTSGILPVELTTFTATLDGSAALLRWTTASETNNAGFDIEHRQSTDAFRTLGFIAGAGTSLETSAYRFTAADLQPGTHVFRLRQVDFDGAFEYSPEVELTVAPTGLVLRARATDRGTIAGSIASPDGQPVEVELFDVLGRRVAVEQASGSFVLGDGLASGVYVVRTGAGTQTVTQSVVVVR